MRCVSCIDYTIQFVQTPTTSKHSEPPVKSRRHRPSFIALVFVFIASFYIYIHILQFSSSMDFGTWQITLVSSLRVSKCQLLRRSHGFHDLGAFSAKMLPSCSRTPKRPRRELQGDAPCYIDDCETRPNEITLIPVAINAL